MGMFDKDKQYGNRLDREFEIGEHFVLYGVDIPGEVISTDFGDAEIAQLKVSKLDNPAHRYVVQTVASAIVDKCKEAERSDFPAVVKLDRVKGRYRSNTLVMQFVAPYNGSGAESPERVATQVNDTDDLPF